LSAVRDDLGARDRRRLLAALALMLSAGCAAASSTSAGVTPELLDKARTQGQVRVIVQLHVASGASSADIAAAQDALLAELPAGSYRLVRRYATIPSLALGASEDALRVLAASPRVLSVVEDRMLFPSR
jgi:hypothetical protein